MFIELLKRYPALEVCKDDIKASADALVKLYQNGGKLLLCGNGGSAADCDHIVGELMKGFLLKRPLSDGAKEELKKKSEYLSSEILDKLQIGLPAVSLSNFPALNTAFCNDVDPDLMFAQGVLGLGQKGDVLIAMSTSGNSRNVVKAAALAKGLGLKVIALTGESGGELKNIADICITVPEKETFKIQELHLPIYHYLCAAVEAHFFCR